MLRNYITTKIGPIIRAYIENNQNLRRLNLEFNELLQKGTGYIADALCASHTLRSLNLKANCIRDDGAMILAQALEDNIVLEELDISLNEITPIGAGCTHNPSYNPANTFISRYRRYYPSNWY